MSAFNCLRKLAEGLGIGPLDGPTSECMLLAKAIEDRHEAIARECQEARAALADSLGPFDAFLSYCEAPELEEPVGIPHNDGRTYRPLEGNCGLWYGCPRCPLGFAGYIQYVEHMEHVHYVAPAGIGGEPDNRETFGGPRYV